MMIRRWVLPVTILVMLAACGDDDHARRLASAGPNPSLDALMQVADPGNGRRVFGQCLACHTIGQGQLDRAGPNLHAIMGKPVAGGSDRFGYTVALSRIGGRWDLATMDRWLADPQRFAPGTRMSFAGLADPLDRADVIRYLEAGGK